MTVEGSRGSRRVSDSIILTCVHFCIVVGLLGYHVKAEYTTVESGERTLLERLSLGPEYFTTMDMVFFGIINILGLELLSFIVHNSEFLSSPLCTDWMNCKQIPVRGKHLDDLQSIDRLCIGISKAQIAPFAYFFVQFCLWEPNILWSLEDISFKTLLLPLPAYFIVFDFFYTIMHWALHIKAIYGIVHKHHHIQKAPSRATNDAVNLHPLEFFLGEYNHLFTVYLCCHLFNLQGHVLSTILFLLIAAVLAGWNHTRFDIEFAPFGIRIYDSKAHDVHHRIPQSNYGQYTMFWDRVFGTYRPYDPKDRVNPQSQLDPKTGKSYSYSKEKSR